MLHFAGEKVFMSAKLQSGSHNARPFRDGVLFIDADDDRLRYVGRSGDEDRSMVIPTYNPNDLTHTDLDESGVARQGFGRGLCQVSNTIVASGSSPSTVTIYDLKGNKQLASVNLSMDVRTAIHGLELWPY